MFKRNFVVWDIESDSANPEECNPVQVAAIAVNGISLKPIKGSEFNIVIRPDDIEKDEYVKAHADTIKWHAKLIPGQTEEDVIERWKKGVQEKRAWQSFKEYCDQYNPKKSYFTAPVPVGANIINFDLRIYKRLNQKHGIKQDFFWLRDAIDIQTWFYSWMEGRDDCPKNFKMDTMREYFGFSSENAHDALNDVLVEAKMFIRFMKLHREAGKRVNFAKAFAADLSDGIKL